MRRAGGFTLLEVLVAMAVFALLGAMAYRMLGAMTATAGSLSANTAKQLAAQRVLWLVGEDLRWAAPRPVRVGDSEHPAVEGGPTTLLALSRGGRGYAPQRASALFRVRYQWSDPGATGAPDDAGTLYRDVWPVLDRAADAKPAKQVLATGIDEFEVRFLDAHGAWRERWPPQSVSGDAGDPARLPKAIEIRIDGGPFEQVRRVVVLP